MIKRMFVFSGALFFLIFGREALANGLDISNVSLQQRDPSSGTVVVQFDLSWQNSWRTKINHDAVWLTVRLRKASDTEKKLCSLTASGIDPAGTSVGTDSNLEIYVPADKKGAFVRPSVYGTYSTVSSTGIQLTVDYGSCGLSSTDDVEAMVFALEMVYVPQGAFYAGDYNGSVASFQEGSADSDPWYISGEEAINVSNSVTDGYRYVSAGNSGEDGTGASFTVPAGFPKGYAAFYVMKYEITEGQWVDFVNSLSAAARVNRDLTDANHKNSDLVLARNTISCSGTPLVCGTSRPARAVSYLSWMDLAAFLDWAALRPMTELEFEKVARGPLLSLSGEFAWGSSSITAAAAISGSVEDGSETVTTTGANAHYNNTILTGGDAGNGAQYAIGPLRVGIFAAGASDRESAGAGYYGVMELSGNVWERVVTVGNATGRLFDGEHGDGVLSSAGGYEGNADVASWPGMDATASRGVTGAAGSGFRGGSWSDSIVGRLSVSDRNDAANTDASAYNNAGGRGVRTYE